MSDDFFDDVVPEDRPDVLDGPDEGALSDLDRHRGWEELGYANLYDFLEVLASYGFVVMSVDPRDGTYQNAADWSTMIANRIQDFKRLISFADGLSAKGGQIAGLIDMNKIATAGHSAGGWAALIGAGAQWSCPPGSSTGSAARRPLPSRKRLSSRKRPPLAAMKA